MLDASDMNWIQVIISNPTVAKHMAVGHLLGGFIDACLRASDCVANANNNRWPAVQSYAGSDVWAHMQHPLHTAATKADIHLCLSCIVFIVFLKKEHF